MNSIIYVDSCISMYQVGAAHPNKKKVIDAVTRIVTLHEQVVASAECFQEIIHRYRALNKIEIMDAAYSALESILTAVIELRKEDTDHALLLTKKYPKLSSRDCLHAAVMKRIGCVKIWTFDEGFDSVPTIERVC